MSRKALNKIPLVENMSFRQLSNPEFFELMKSMKNNFSSRRKIVIQIKPKNISKEMINHS